MKKIMTLSNIALISILYSSAYANTTPVCPAGLVYTDIPVDASLIDGSNLIITPRNHEQIINIDPGFDVAFAFTGALNGASVYTENNGTQAYLGQASCTSSPCEYSFQYTDTWVTPTATGLKFALYAGNGFSASTPTLTACAVPAAAHNVNFSLGDNTQHLNATPSVSIDDKPVIIGWNTQKTQSLNEGINYKLTASPAEIAVINNASITGFYVPVMNGQTMPETITVPESTDVNVTYIDAGTGSLSVTVTGAPENTPVNLILTSLDGTQTIIEPLQNGQNNLSVPAIHYHAAVSPDIIHGANTSPNISNDDINIVKNESQSIDINFVTQASALNYQYSLRASWRSTERYEGQNGPQLADFQIFNANASPVTLSNVTFKTNASDVSVSGASGTLKKTAESTWEYTTNATLAAGARLDIPLNVTPCVTGTDSCPIALAVPPYDIKINTTTANNIVPDVQGLCAGFSGDDFKACSNGSYTAAKKKVIAYYPEWGFWHGYFPYQDTESTSPLPYNNGQSNIPVKNLDVINYAFLSAGPFIDGTAGNFCTSGTNCFVSIFDGKSFGEFDPVSAPYNLTEMIMLKRQYPHLTLSMSVGGWSLSYPFMNFTYTDAQGASHNSVFDPQSFAAMSKRAIDELSLGDYADPSHEKYGIDIDWEYPGGDTRICGLDASGAYTCADVKENDPTLGATNYVDTMVKLREQLPHSLLSSALPAGKTQIDTIGKNWTIVQDKLDFLNIMTYDYHGAFDYNGPADPGYADFHAPFSMEDNDPFNVEGHDSYYFATDKTLSVYQSYGVKINSKVILGLPAYGRMEQVTALDPQTHSLYQPLTNFTAPIGSGEGNDSSALWGYRCVFGLATNKDASLCSSPSSSMTTAFLNSVVNGDIQFESAPIGTHTQTSKMSWLWGTITGKPVFMSFDDVSSVQTKIAAYQSAYPAFGGVMFWDLSTDMHSEDKDFAKGSLIKHAAEALN